jgi:hypothetical protein
MIDVDTRVSMATKMTTKTRKLTLPWMKIRFFFLFIMSAETRSTTKIPLFDHPLEHIPGVRLPTNEQTYRHYLYHTRVLRKNLKDATRNTLDAVLVFWDKAGLKTKKYQNCLQEVRKLDIQYKVNQSCEKITLFPW